MAKSLEKTLKKIRKGIPDKYNQCEILDYLNDDDVDAMVSITTRSDGKTFNIIRALIYLNIELGFKTLIVTHHSEQQLAMVGQIQDVVDIDPKLDVSKFNYYNNMDYTSVLYGEDNPFIIMNLNNAGDAKFYSAVLRDCNLTLFDEFLVHDGDYVPDEFNRFKTIFETMDRDYIPTMAYTNDRRKTIFLANPINFNSEFLAVWQLYEPLANQPINTIKKYKNFVIERRKNINAQEFKNNRLFPDEQNESVTGQFKINNWGITDVNHAKTQPVIIKTPDKYIKMYMDNAPIIDVVAINSVEDYQYNTDLKDNTDNSIYLDERFYYQKMYNYYNRGLFKFSNQYSKNYIFDNYPELDMSHLYRDNRHCSSKESDLKPEEIDELIEFQRIQNIKRRLIMDYMQ